MLKISTITFKKSEKTGTQYAKVVLADGREATMFDNFPNYAFIKAGDEIAGDVKVGDYKGKTSYTIYSLSKPGPGVPRANAINQAMDKKHSFITESQEDKKESIKIAACARDATLLTVAWSNKTDVPFVSENDLKDKWLEFRKWLSDNFGDDEPPF